MYSDGDIEAAVAAGALDSSAAQRLRDFVASSRGTPAADEEGFRLLTGFNDIFVTIAAILLLVAVGWIGGTLAPSLAGAPVAVVAWGLAEYFTRVRRMALPSILLLLAFTGGLFMTVMALLPGHWSAAAMNDTADPGMRHTALVMALGGLVTAVGAYAHWRRFHVPITIAAGAGAAVALIVGSTIALVPAMADHARLLTFVCGIGVFLLAMRWDMSDPARTTRRSDVAFWLHLLAAPLLVHPVFISLGLLGAAGGVAAAGIVLVLYVVLAAVALAIDRRALMVSALAYVLYALSALFREFGAVGLNIAFTAMLRPTAPNSRKRALSA